MSSVKVHPIVKSTALIGEGPVWEESEQTLLFVDIIGQKIHRWSPATNRIQSVETADTVGFAVPRRSGGYVAGVGRNIVAVDWQTHKVTSLVEVDEDKPNNRLNDGKADPSGRLLTGQSAHLVTVLPACLSVAMVTVGCVLGTMLKDYPSGERKQGALFSVAPDLTVTKHLSQVDISNGMDWSEDQKTFFYIDSLALTVDAFDHDPSTGHIGNRRVVCHIQEGEGIPDGMTLDAEGRLWVACYDGGRVINIDPATGVRLKTISLPVTKTTSCCFGGPDYSELYVTSASLGLNQSESKQQPLAGSTFRVTGLGVKGRPSYAFSG
uniref:Regucalcin n=1 Tax=Astatotilapia calliptera TaxID=8154 RepID=A0AAX7SYM3_ASTCA